MQEKIEAILAEVHKSVVGQDEMLQTLMLALLCEGHILLESVPGLAKTTAVKAFSQSVNTSFKRVQFTPDLLPGDITGSLIYNRHSETFSMRYGPIFSHIVLADEINRAPAKVQSALLEAMAEYQVTVGDTTYSLPRPFLVLATQNPLEHEGVYSLPEAQLDRFMFKINLNYLSVDEELAMTELILQENREKPQAILTLDELEKMKEVSQQVFIDAPVKRYMIDLIFATREPLRYGLESLNGVLRFGASPRATLDLFRASRAQAYLRKRDYVTPLDIALVLKPILRHRIGLTYDALAEGKDADSVIDTILRGLRVP